MPDAPEASAVAADDSALEAPRPRARRTRPPAAPIASEDPAPESSLLPSTAASIDPAMARAASESESVPPARRFPLGPAPDIVPRAFDDSLLDEDAVRVVRRLHRNGFEAFLVGGVVRDLLLGRTPKDFDIATNARPHDVKAVFRNCRIIGRRFRLAHILFGGGKVIETATFRRDPTGHDEADVEDDAPRSKPRHDDADLLIRHDNVFGEPHEDALRRDFRLNGLFYDVERREVIDFVGGLKDIEARVVNTIGLPDVRFREDPVRILRAIKFSARCDVGIDPECLDAMIAQREELRKAAKPRLFEEVLRLLRGGAAHRSFWLAWETGVLAVLLPQLHAMLDDDAPRVRDLWVKLDAVDALVRSGQAPSDTVLMTVLLGGVIEEALEGARDPAAAYDDLMLAINDLLALPRRVKERARILLGCQRRIRSGKLGQLPQRDFWPEALELYALEARARGEDVEVPSVASEAGPSDAEPRRRRRRR